MKPSPSPEVELRPGERLDVFLGGRLRLIQSQDGYRFSIDAVLLADFVSVRPGTTVIDLGTGCGIIPLLLLLQRDAGRVVGLEIQPELAEQAARNAVLNGLAHRLQIIRGDIRYPPLKHTQADLVTCNPPYRKPRSGRTNPDLRRAIARHEILVSIDDILLAARGLLRKRGRFALIYPCTRLTDVLLRLRRFGLEPKRVQFIFPGLEQEGRLALIEAVKGGMPGVKVAPPILGQGDYTIKRPVQNQGPG